MSATPLAGGSEALSNPEIPQSRNPTDMVMIELSCYVGGSHKIMAHSSKSSDENTNETVQSFIVEMNDVVF